MSGSQDNIVLIIAISRVRMVQRTSEILSCNGHHYMGQPPHNKVMTRVLTICEMSDGIWTSEYLDGVGTPAHSERDQS